MSTKALDAMNSSWRETDLEEGIRHADTSSPILFFLTFANSYVSRGRGGRVIYFPPSRGLFRSLICKLSLKANTTTRNGLNSQHSQPHNQAKIVHTHPPRHLISSKAQTRKRQDPYEKTSNGVLYLFNMFHETSRGPTSPFPHVRGASIWGRSDLSGR